MARVFVIRPFGTKKDSLGKEIDFERVHRDLIDPALKATKLEGGTTGTLVEPGNIREDMFALILEADLAVCDITVHNANVFYELGIRHALRKKRTVLIKGGPTTDSTPFDILTDRYQAYDIDHPDASVNKLAETINAAMVSERETDSPIFRMLPSLTEATPSAVAVVPLAFREEVNRAQSAKSKGWLRLLCEEVKDRRFQWEGLRLVAAAQWQLKDYEGARHSWEMLRGTYPNDIAANLALANIYERLYRKTEQKELLAESRHALDRVLGNVETSRKELAEALALKGRNEKTCWRLEFERLKTTDERRKAAMNRALIRSYEAYRDAFLEDLNHFYPGLSALQMGVILLDLADSDEWFDAFDSDDEADGYREKLQETVQSFRSLIPVSVSAGLRRMGDADPERIWAEISNADVIFLTDSGRERRVVSTYRNAIPVDNPFAWDAARGQLALFATLGIKSDLANRVIAEIDARFADRRALEEGKPIHLVLFAGHRVDKPDRPLPRFPQKQEGKARTLIRDALSSLMDDKHQLLVLASAAPGGDILAHEVATELHVSSIICLPMPTEHFARSVFEDLDKWRTRFLDLQQDHNVLVLNDREGLPKWLQGSGVNPWERGNQWVLKMALTWGAGRITLLALWDGKKTGDEPGGTAHMVRLAEEAGNVYIERIDSTQLAK